MTTIRCFRGAAAIALGLAPLLGGVTGDVAAQAPPGPYPTRPIRVIVAIPAGSGTDLIARSVAQALTERLGRQVIVENRPGAGTTIANEAVAKAKPDGYTLLVNGAALTISKVMYKKLGYDPGADFAPITIAVVAPNLLCVHPSIPAKSVKELIALAIARPGELLFSSGGHGTNSHMASELFASMAGIRLTHVPYKGSIPGVTDLVGGHVAIMTNAVSTLLPLARANKVRALGVGSPKRVAAAPDIPTIAEAGLPGYESAQWTGWLAPAGTPPDIVARLHREITAVLRSPENKERLAVDGSEVVANSPDEFVQFIKADLAKWARVVKSTGLTPQ